MGAHRAEDAKETVQICQPLPCRRSLMVKHRPSKSAIGGSIPSGGSMSVWYSGVPRSAKSERGVRILLLTPGL